MKKEKRRDSSHESAGMWIRRQGYEWKKSLRRNWQLYLLLIPVVTWYLVFCYGPMYGIQIAFKDFSIGKGIWDSPWVGLKHLKRYLNSPYFGRTLKNTLTLSIYSLLVGIPLPICLALLFNEVKNKRTRSVLQAISYAPTFISVVVMASMIIMFMQPHQGFVDAILRFFGYSKEQSILGSPDAFKHIYVWTGMWQGIGWSSVIYSAAIEGVSQELYEAATVQGASKLRQIWHITLPTIRPTIAMCTLMSVGGLLGGDTMKVLLLQNGTNAIQSEILGTYVYKMGLGSAQYSFAAMVGLFNSVISLMLLIFANRMSKKLTETSLW